MLSDVKGAGWGDFSIHGNFDIRMNWKVMLLKWYVAQGGEVNPKT